MIHPRTPFLSQQVVSRGLHPWSLHAARTEHLRRVGNNTGNNQNGDNLNADNSVIQRDETSDSRSDSESDQGRDDGGHRSPLDGEFDLDFQKCSILTGSQ